MLAIFLNPTVYLTMFFIQIILLCLPAFLFANISSRRAPLNSSISADPPDGTNVTQVTNSGNGCPRNTLTITTNPDQTIVFSKLNAFETNLGPNISPAEKSKNCAFHVSITYPADWQFMLVQSTFFGWARVDQGIGGHFYTQYFVASNASYTVGFVLSSSIRLDSNKVTVLITNGHHC
jgi:hypothetical protein